MNKADSLVARADALLERSKNDPFAKRYYEKTWLFYQRGERLPSLTSAADALGERLMSSVMPLHPNVKMPHFDGTTDFEIRVSVATLMQRAQVFLWKKEILEELKFVQLPPHAISPSILPYPEMYMTFSDVVYDADHPEMGLIDWLFVWQHTPSLEHPNGGIGFLWSLTIEGQGKNGSLELQGFSIEGGKRFPEDTGEEVAFLLKLLAFINSPYVDSDEQPLDRPSRRYWQHEMIKQKRMEAIPPVRVVQLRTKEYETKEYNPTGRHPGETGHWYVRSHIRRQWYASEKAHHLIWIPQHLKGNPQMPLKKPNKVFKVAR